MSIDLVMPKLGLTMTEGLIQEWVAKPGAAFKAGTVLLVVETEKIANEVEAVADGVLDAVLIAAGETVPCGAAIAKWTPAGNYVAPAQSAQTNESFLSEVSQMLPPPPGISASAPVRAAGQRILSTPYARKLARSLNVDLASIAGSGPRGRVKGPDVQAARSNASAVAARAPVTQTAPTNTQLAEIAVSAPSTATRRPATAFEKTTAERLTAAKQVPHFYLATEIEVSPLEALRTQLNRLENRPKVSVTHLLLAALARTLNDVPQANQVWDRGEIVSFASVDIGIAVSTERGLLAPMLRDLGSARVHDVAERTRALVERTRTNKLRAEDFGGGATSISNAGMHDVTHMTSIITPGHSSIFGVGSVREVFRPGAKGEPLLKRELGIVLSCDHRILDGVGGLGFLNRLKFYLENPLQIVV
jgi:pyruvate dehydrogenase E2 component (dihydrolipoamide acetyltransferase)